MIIPIALLSRGSVHPGALAPTEFGYSRLPDGRVR